MGHADRPYLSDDWRALAHEAEEALRRREAMLLTVKDQGKADKAATLSAEIRVWRAIAADWHWIVLHDRPSALPGETPVTGEEKLIALADSLDRCRKAVRQAHDRIPSEIRFFMPEGQNLTEMELIFGPPIADFLAAHYRRDRVAALFWHQDPLRNAALHVAVATTIRIRDQQRRAAQGRQAA